MGWRNEPWSLPREFMQFKKSAKGIATSMVAVIVVIAVIWLVMSSYYTVEANEQAVVLRFGKDAGVRDPGRRAGRGRGRLLWHERGGRLCGGCGGRFLCGRWGRRARNRRCDRGLQGGGRGRGWRL